MIWIPGDKGSNIEGANRIPRIVAKGSPVMRAMRRELPAQMGTGRQKVPMGCV